MTKPNTFIIGAPKCGTTSLHKYLGQHPDVFSSKNKEPHFFVQEDFPAWWEIKEKDYLNLFSEVEGESVILESSVWYLYSNSSVQKIRDFQPDAKIIIMLRNPIEMVSALHAENFKNRQETVQDFQKAWELNANRKVGLDIPKTCRAKQILYYDEVAKYYEQLQRLYSIFPKEQVMVVFFDDFKENTSLTFLRVLEFLGLNNFTKVDFSPINERKALRSTLLGDLTRGRPPFLFNLYRKVKALLNIEKLGILKALRSFNEVSSLKAVVSPELCKLVYDEYADDIRELEKLTKRDLSSWRP